MRAKLTERDVVILVNIYKYRYLSFSQLSRLHFPSVKTAYRRLQTLTALGYLKAFTARAFNMCGDIAAPNRYAVA